MRQADSVGPYFTITACCKALGIESKTAIRYRVMKYRVPMRRIGVQDYIHLEKLRAVFEKEREAM